MKIDISDIVKVNGASIDLDFQEKIEGFDTAAGEYKFDKPTSFKGILTNNKGVLKLEGHLRTDYMVKCYRCLKDTSGELVVSVKEAFLSASAEADDEIYTYEGNYLEIEKVLKDNIILNLPMKQLCNINCKGLCDKCGANLNITQCSCREEEINPHMEVLKDYFNNN